MKFCPSCGKKVGEGTFCTECRPVPELRLKNIKIKVCINCGKFNYKNKWTKYLILEGAVRKVVNDKLKGKVDNYDIKVDIPKVKHNPGVNVVAECKIGVGHNFFIVPAELNFTTCGRCSKQTGDYFEGTLQVKNPGEEVIKYIDSYINEKGVYCSKRKEEKDFAEIKLNNKKELHALGRKLMDKFGGMLKVSPHLHSFDNQRSKNIYRINVFYQPYDFRIGDVILVDNRIFRISRLGKLVYGKNLISDKSTTLNLKNLNYKVLEKHDCVVSKVYPEIEVIHPVTFQSIKVENKKKVKPGEKVKAVLAGNKLFII